MEIKEYVKTVLKEVITGLEESEQELGREMHLSVPQDNKSVEFDIATTVENSLGKQGNLKGAVKVLGFGVDSAGEMKAESKDSSTSRIKFGVYVNTQNKKQEASNRQGIKEAQNQHRPY
jgi:hypothetical protein